MTILVDPPKDDAEAKDVLATAYDKVFSHWSDDTYVFPNDYPNLFALGIAQAIGLMEGKYGKWGPNGKSNNWGAITRAPNSDGSCPADSFPHKDSSFELGEYTTCFRKYSTSLSGAEDFLRELYAKRPAVFEAALAGDIRGVAEEMYATNYYLGTAPPNQKDSNGAFTNVNRYIAFIGRGVDQIAHLYPAGPEPSESNAPVAAIAITSAAVLGLALAMNR